MFVKIVEEVEEEVACCGLKGEVEMATEDNGEAVESSTAMTLPRMKDVSSALSLVNH